MEKNILVVCVIRARLFLAYKNSSENRSVFIPGKYRVFGKRVKVYGVTGVLR